MTEFTKPAYPLILTRKDWDKKKGVIAKMAGKTGIGEQCDKVFALYNAVHWDRLDLVERRRTVLQNWKDDSYTKANWEKLVKEAMAEVTGNMAKLSAELYKLRDLCTKAAANFKKLKAIPSSSTQHVLTMAKTADHLGVQLNKNSMGGVLSAMNKEFLDEVKTKFIDPMWPGIRTYAKQHANLMAEIKRTPTPNKLNGDGRTGIRDLTTGLGNIAKLGERGWGPKNDSARTLCTQLTPWANSQSGLVEPGASAQDVLAEVAKIEPIFNRALQLVAAAR
jgi:hypothetical protein